MLHPSGGAILLHPAGDALADGTGCCCSIDTCTQMASCFAVVGSIVGRDIEVTFGGIADSFACTDCNELLNRSFIISGAGYGHYVAQGVEVCEVTHQTAVLAVVCTNQINHFGFYINLTIRLRPAISAGYIEVNLLSISHTQWSNSIKADISALCRGESVSVSRTLSDTSPCNTQSATCSIRLL